MSSEERFVDKFMKVTGQVSHVLGQADRSDADAPVVHKHDDFEQASEEDLSHFESETGSNGEHYAVRKDDPHH
ncbi:hypothetical protein [Arthrobacter sp. 35W]|uniref:hypothetical protein n=1 Tax=Arthrobacter sp. 35W TaxID=1132441 RepID=UPI00042855EB|nr:hypothetical protein [Arthrobacter sp. 35W]